MSEFITDPIGAWYFLKKYFDSPICEEMAEQVLAMKLFENTDLWDLLI